MARIGGCLALLILLTGCDSGIQIVPVRGMLTLDGRPLAFKSLMFIPEPGTPGHGGGANTAEDGSFSLIASIPGGTTDRSGVAPGRYRVIVFEPTIPINQELPLATGDESEPLPAIGPSFGPRKKVIPTVYASQETTPLVLEVPAAGGELQVKLSSKPG